MTKSSGKPRLTRKQKARRKFLGSIAYTGAITGAALLGYYPVMGQGSGKLRPPGALLEKDFLASCIKCGQCVQVCPVEAIKLADITDGFGVGSPYIDAREQACDFSCDGLQCVLACPTGSLTHDINYPAQSNMGIASLKFPNACLAMQGKGFKGVARGPDFKGGIRFEDIDRWAPTPLADYPFDLEVCDLCVRLCPIEVRSNQCDDGKPPANDTNQCPPIRAIELRQHDVGDGVQRMIPTVLQGCVGCGVCEMVCPADRAAIVIETNTDRGIGFQEMSA